MEKVLVLGASNNPARFSHKAIKSLRRRKIDVLAIGIEPGWIEDVDISIVPIHHQPIHTVILYLVKENQTDYYDYILNLQPKQVIFNPGAENPEFVQKLNNKGVKVIMDCALVLIHASRLGMS